MDIQNEEFKPVTGYEGLYEVSNKGRVKSLSRKTRVNDKIRKHQTRENGYQSVGLWLDGHQEIIPVRNLVADAFIDRITGQDLVIQLDGDQSNNNSSNLIWVSSSPKRRRRMSLDTFSNSLNDSELDFRSGEVDLWCENFTWGDFMASLKYSQQACRANGTHGINSRSSRTPARTSSGK